MNSWEEANPLENELGRVGGQFPGILKNQWYEQQSFYQYPFFVSPRRFRLCLGPKKELPVQDQLRKRLVAGDMTALPELVEGQSLGTLYYFLRQAQTHQFRDNSPKVQSAVVDAISKIPGHGKYIGDYIEELTAKRNTGRLRNRQFSALSAVGSKEAIEQIGRFLFDDRDPDANSGVSPLDGLVPAKNSELAATAMGVALGDKSPVTKRKPGAYGLEEIALIQKWWKENHPTPPQSSEGKSPPNSTPQQAPASKEKHSQDSSQEAKPRADAVISEAPSWVWMVVGAATLAGSGLTFLRAKRQRR